MNKIIPYGGHLITDEDISSVVKVLKSDFLTQGPSVKLFEDSFADYVGSKFAIAVSNGTAALHLCTLALGLKPGEKVITTPITFVASANCVRYCGGEVEFVDIDPETYLIDLNKVEDLLKKDTKGVYKGIIPVDFAGRANNLEEVRKLADEYGLWIIEDACHSPGGYFNDSLGKIQKCGNGNFADLAIFSFHPVKHIAAGEGGMITTNNETLYKRILNLRTHGIQQDLTKRLKFDGPWYYEMQELGYNYRLTDIQAALGSSQLNRAHFGIERRKEIAEKYRNAFIDKNFIYGQSGIVDGHAYHLYILEVENRNELFKYLRDKDIFCQVHYIPAYRMPYYESNKDKKVFYSNSEKYYERCISLPIFPHLTLQEQDYVIKTICEFYE
jgi:UDP-4-amino-4,6-dideoxy-N-acetyl-beta-L-altrosamine transaminase